MTTITPIPIAVSELQAPICWGAGYTSRVGYTGDQVKMFRARRGWSQQELAKRAGLDKQTVFRIESGGNTRHGTTGKLATALGVSLSQLIDEPRPRRTGHAETDVQAALWNYPALADHLGGLLKGIGQMRPKDRSDFLRALAALLAALEHARPAASSGNAEDA